MARLLLRRWYLALAALLAASMLAFISSGGGAGKLEGTPSYCALVIPPPQIAGRAELEAVYCKGFDADRQCQTNLGWIVVSEPVPCD
jgi:hypothetical protein